MLPGSGCQRKVKFSLYLHRIIFNTKIELFSSLTLMSSYRMKFIDLIALINLMLVFVFAKSPLSFRATPGYLHIYLF